jgi:hypothetical protein
MAFHAPNRNASFHFVDRNGILLSALDRSLFGGGDAVNCVHPFIQPPSPPKALLPSSTRFSGWSQCSLGVPCSEDVLLNSQSTSFHDATAMRWLFGLQAAPEFEYWLHARDIVDGTPLAIVGDEPRRRLLNQKERDDLRSTRRLRQSGEWTNHANLV